MPARREVSRPLARGDVVLVPFPFTDLPAAKLRPAVVLRADASRGDVVVAFVGSREVLPSDPGDVAVLPTHPEFSSTGLAAPSKIRAAKLVTLSRSIVRRWLGRLGPLLVADIERALVAALEINTVPYREEGRRRERERLAALTAAGGPSAAAADLSAP